MSDDVKITHINLNDGTCAGLLIPTKKVRLECCGKSYLIASCSPHPVSGLHEQTSHSVLF